MLRYQPLVCHFLRQRSPRITNLIFSHNSRAMSDMLQQEPLRQPDRDGNAHSRKRPYQGGRGAKRQKIRKEKPIKEGSNEEVLLYDVIALLERQKLAAKTSIEGKEVDASPPRDSENDIGIGYVSKALPESMTEIEVKVLELSSTGDGLALHPFSSQVFVVPFSTPGDIIKAKVIKHHPERHYSHADFVSVVAPGPLRDDTRINCKYFSTCSGCQFQMLDYPDQLEHKKRIVERAYENFSQLSPELVPRVGDTMGSPLQYGYRTKLTPHFDGPPGHLSKQARMRGERNFFETAPDIGFMRKGLNRTLDIEDCPIGTDAVRMGMKRERIRVGEELKKYKRGATILLRESTLRVPKNDERAETTKPETIKTTTENYTEFKSCITDNNASSTEYIDDFVFTNPAGSFFQNNNSILPSFTNYIREQILPPKSSGKEIKYLIDAYSGSGLFTITLSSLFTSSTGIDISIPSISFAAQNAKLNNLPSEKCKFIAADAPELFKSVVYPRDETVVVLDPPRKGCDESFLKQLMRFGPRRVVYVSCNVHTQARDVGILVRGQERAGEEGGSRYEIESLRGFDFFPQTGHVEGVAVLNRVDVEVSNSEDKSIERSV